MLDAEPNMTIINITIMFYPYVFPKFAKFGF